MNKSTVKAIEDFLMVKSDALEKALLCFCFGFPRKELYEAAEKIFKSGLCDYILIYTPRNKNIVAQPAFKYFFRSFVKLFSWDSKAKAQ